MEEEPYVFTQARDIGHLITFHIIFCGYRSKARKLMTLVSSRIIGTEERQEQHI